MKTSKHIEQFLAFSEDVQTKHRIAVEMVGKCDKLTQDLLHKLELEELSTSEKNKVATQLRYCRRDRRYWKDQVEEYAPFANLFSGDATESKTNKRFINLLREALGKTRKQEDYHSDRTYKPRILRENS